jgi:hypothetical protein
MAGAEKDQGQWVIPPVSYVDPLRQPCALCGRPLARRFWRETRCGRVLHFCEPAHAVLYEEYWYPLYGDPEDKVEERGA